MCMGTVMIEVMWERESFGKVQSRLVKNEMVVRMKVLTGERERQRPAFTCVSCSRLGVSAI